MSGNSRPSRLGWPGGEYADTIDPSVAAVTKVCSFNRVTVSDSRRPIWRTVKPSGKVTRVYVCAGGVRSTAMMLPIVSIGRIE